MTFARSRIAIVAIALGVAACGGDSGTGSAQTPGPSPSSQGSHSPSPTGVTFNINPEPGVKAAGTITVFAGPTSTTIELKISGLVPASSHVSHIHTGGCAPAQRGPIVFALNQVIADGQGQADVRSTLFQKYPPATGHWYVVVHAGLDMQGSNAAYLLCGNLFF